MKRFLSTQLASLILAMTAGVAVAQTNGTATNGWFYIETNTTGKAGGQIVKSNTARMAVLFTTIQSTQAANVATISALGSTQAVNVASISALGSTQAVNTATIGSIGFTQAINTASIAANGASILLLGSTQAVNTASILSIAANQATDETAIANIGATQAVNTASVAALTNNKLDNTNGSHSGSLNLTNSPSIILNAGASRWVKIDVIAAGNAFTFSWITNGPAGPSNVNTFTFAANRLYFSPGSGQPDPGLGAVGAPYSNVVLVGSATPGQVWTAVGSSGLGGWSNVVGGSGSAITNTGFVFVDKTGSDATGIRNDPSHPVFTIPAAISAGLAYDVVDVGDGKFTNDQIRLKEGMVLRGKGYNVSEIYGTNLIQSPISGPIVLLTNNVRVQGLAIRVLTNGLAIAGGLMAPIGVDDTRAGAGFGETATGFVIENCLIGGITDAAYFRTQVYGAEGEIINCVLTSRWDCAALTHPSTAITPHKINFRNCTLISRGPPTTNVTDARAVNLDQGEVRFYNCDIFVTNGTTYTMGIQARSNANCLAELINTRIETGSAQGGVFDIVATNGATVRNYGLPCAANKLSGTVQQFYSGGVFSNATLTNVNGTILPGTDNAFDLGDGNLHFRDINLRRYVAMYSGSGAALVMLATGNGVGRLADVNDKTFGRLGLGGSTDTNAAIQYFGSNNVGIASAGTGTNGVGLQLRALSPTGSASPSNQLGTAFWATNVSGVAYPTFTDGNSNSVTITGTTNTSATLGGLTLPATALGFLTIQVNGAVVKVPYFLP